METVTLDTEILDRVDELVTPGTTLNAGVVATELPNHITHADTKQGLQQLTARRLAPTATQQLPPSAPPTGAGSGRPSRNSVLVSH